MEHIVKKGIIVTVVVLALGGMVAASMLRDQENTRGTKVTTAEAERRAITQVVKASGQIDPRVKVNLSAHVIAKIERLHVEEGDEVTAGQPVLELERELFQAAWERATAQLQIAQTQLRKAEVEQRDAELKMARAKRLEEAGIVAADEREAAELRAASAELAIAQAKQEIDRVRADLNKARDDLDKVTLYAPVSGRVIALNAEEGEVVVSGTMNNPASVIGTIADLSEILAEVDVDETDIVDVGLGQTGKVLVDALPDATYTGRVVEVGSSGYERPGQGDVTFFKVKLLLEDADERLRPGMSARAEIEVATHEQAIVVPIQTVVYRPPVDEDTSDEEQRVVFVVEDDKAVQRPVDVGIADATDIEITGGIAPGDKLVVGPYRTLKDLEHDTAVRVDEDDADAGTNGEDREAGEDDG